MWNRILALIIKEFYAVWRDKKSRMMLIIPPLLQLFVFSFAVTLDVKNVPIGILNRDLGSESFELIERFRGSPTFSKIITVHNMGEIQKVIDNEKAIVVFHFDEQFSRNLQEGKPAIVQAIMDGRRSNTAQIIQGYASRIIEKFNRDFAKKAEIPVQNSALFVYNWFNPNLIYTWFTVPNLVGTLSMLITIVVTGLSVAREKELGTFEQLLVSPLQPLEIVLGKTIPAVLIGVGEASIIVLAAVTVFGIPFTGSVLLLYISLFVFVLSIVGVGLFISAIAKTQQQAILGVFVFMPPAVMLSGFTTPIENMPQWLQTATLINPLRYFLVIVKGIFLKAMPADLVFTHVWPMMIIGITTLIAAGWFFRRRLE